MSRHRSATVAAVVAVTGAIVCALGQTAATAAAPSPERSVQAQHVEAYKGRYLLNVSSGADLAGVVEQARKAGAHVLHVAAAVRVVTVEADGATAARLAKLTGVAAVNANHAVKAQSLGFDYKTQAGSMTNVTRVTGAQDAWKKGYTGAGIDVAVIDTGIAAVPSLDASTKVVVGPDFSVSENTAATKYMDTYGHGTAMAGIIAGREVNDSSTVTTITNTTSTKTSNGQLYCVDPYTDPENDGYGVMNGQGCVVKGSNADPDRNSDSRTTTVSTGGANNGPAYAADTTNFYGMAPDARLVNVKMADQNGVVDVSQVVAAINWVVQNRTTGGMNIKVINLSYGTESPQNPQQDPLSYAAEQAWKAGLVVVASAGNDGGSVPGIQSPAYNPWIIAVGAYDTAGTDAITDDSIPTPSARQGGNFGNRSVDIVAPGVNIVGPGVPGSVLYDTYTGARIGNGFFRGSGTSQAAAVVSGAAALMLQARSYLSPDQIKTLLMQTANPIPNVAATAQGKGELDLFEAMNAWTSTTLPAAPNGTGTGSIESSRGGVHVAIGDVSLNGELDIMGNSWDPSAFASQTAAKNSWVASTTTTSMVTGPGMTFLGRPWMIGNSFVTGDTSTFAGRTWQGRTWQGRTWQGATWSGRTWQGATWSGRSWSGNSWSGASWSSPIASSSWASSLWAGAGWK